MRTRGNPLSEMQFSQHTGFILCLPSVGPFPTVPGGEIDWGKDWGGSQSLLWELSLGGCR